MSPPFKRRLENRAKLANLVVRAVLRRVVRGPGHPSWSLPFELAMSFMRAVIEVDHHAAAMAQRKRPSFMPPHLLLKVRVSNERLEGVRCQVHTPVGHRPGDPTLLYLHGGGYVTCSPESHKHVIAALAHLTGARVVAPDYRLAPEHPFPAALDDVAACYRALLARGEQPERMAVAGDSAGGGLTLALALTLREQALPLPRALLLFSPWVDLALTHSELEPHASYDYLRPGMLVDTAHQYAAGRSLLDPLISPVHAELSGLPPMLVITGAWEVFHEQNCRLVARARAHGVSVEHVIEPGMLHAFPAFSALAPEGRHALRTAARFVREQLASRLTPTQVVSSLATRKSA